MHLSDIGRIVDREWMRAKEKRTHAIFDEYIIMPDHFHAIIIIHPDETIREDTSACNPHHQQEWQSGCLGAIIQQFKRACSQHIHEMGYPRFRWLSRFHDRIIRDDAEFDRIRRYIIDNPKNWDKNDT